MSLGYKREYSLICPAAQPHIRSPHISCSTKETMDAEAGAVRGPLQPVMKHLCMMYKQSRVGDLEHIRKSH